MMLRLIYVMDNVISSNFLASNYRAMYARFVDSEKVIMMRIYSLSLWIRQETGELQSVSAVTYFDD